MSRLANSWRLAQASWAVLRSDKELIVFPIVSGIASLIVFALFAVPLWISGYFDRLDDGTGNAKVTGFVVLFAMYVVLYTVINYCNAALVGSGRNDSKDFEMGEIRFCGMMLPGNGSRTKPVPAGFGRVVLGS